MSLPDSFEHRILVCTPQGKDAELACRALVQAGFSCHICETLTILVEEVQRGAGAILVVEEVLPQESAAMLTDYIATQPTWSDLPVLVLTKPGGELPWTRDAYEKFGNLTLLERPVRAPTLISAARSALRARQRQYEIRLADRRKDEFLAMLAHELRNPLAPINSAATLLEMAPNDPDRVKRSSKIIARQVGHMSNLIDDLLDVARVTRGLITLDKHAVDLRDIVTEAVEQIRPMITKRHHELTFDMPASAMPVMGDRERLVQVVVNILNNSAKYTPEDGHIKILLDARDDLVTLEIQDDGIGMPPLLLTQVFEMFAQAERTSDRSQGGLGLGLALVKSLVESHGGKVSASSDGPGQGSTFKLQFARLSNDSIKEKSTAIEPTIQTGDALKVLVVDDNRDAANTMEMLLSMAGHTVSVEYAAQAALEGVESFLPQVCLLDIGLPDMDGLELARRLRANPATANTTLIAITGYSQKQDLQRSVGAGFNYHLVKPIDTERLLGLLTKVAHPD